MKKTRILAAIVGLSLVVSALGAGLPQPWRKVLEQIRPDSLEGHVSFLASDLLEGRDTPSRGLSIAAEYIASQFRRAGLEPGGDDGYFQTAHWKVRTENPLTGALMIRSRNRIIRVARKQFVIDADAALVLPVSPVIRVDFQQLPEGGAGELRGKVVATVVPDSGRAGLRRRRRLFRAYQRFARAMRKARPKLVLVADPGGDLMRHLRKPKLIDPQNPPPGSPPVIVVRDAAIAALLGKTPTGPAEIFVSAVCGKPLLKEQKLRNVIGILRGSDASLKNTVVIVSAHYDHIGMATSGSGDRIFNGANDDASGAAAVIEIASALARLTPPPQRSIAFVTFFGEEKGLLGSAYYVRHPVFPLAHTVADLNLEQIGRTDSSQGPQIRNATITGFDFSNVSSYLVRAGRMTGIRVYKDGRNSVRFFRKSDNFSLAKRGVPAHSISTAFVYPDYHGLGDRWNKLDYANMAAVTRMLAVGTLLIADSPEAPRWNAANPATKPFRAARHR